MIDCHLHSVNSGDSTASIAAMCQAAVEKGLREICFTEHVDFEPTDRTYGAFHYQTFCEQVREARAQFGESLEIRLGVEIDYQEKYRNSIETFLQNTQFDYVLGAVHYVDGVIMEDHSTYFPGRTVDQAYRPYFETVLGAVNTGLFDAIAHMDLCKRYGVRYFGPFDWLPFKTEIESILQAMIRRGTALEVNTSGLRQSPEEPYPALGILDRYFALGGRHITVGSDAHICDDVGANIQDALLSLMQLGFTEADTFVGRKRVSRQLSDVIAVQNKTGEIQ